VDLLKALNGADERPFAKSQVGNSFWQLSELKAVEYTEFWKFFGFELSEATFAECYTVPSRTHTLAIDLRLCRQQCGDDIERWIVALDLQSFVGIETPFAADAQR